MAPTPQTGRTFGHQFKRTVINMKTLAFIALAAGCVLVSGCVFVRVKDAGNKGNNGKRIVGNGIITEKIFEVADFSAVMLDVPADVDYTVSDTPSLRVRVDENLLEYLTVSVEDGMLRIGSVNRQLRNFKKLEIEMSSSSLEFLKCNGAVDFVSDGRISGETFVLEVNGAADVELPGLDVRTADFKVNGAGDIEVGLANAESVSLNISGAGDAKISGKTESVSIQINGTGDVDLTQLDYDRLDKSINGMGSVKTPRKSTL